MADTTQEYAVAPLTGETAAVDPPLQESETPLMGNPVLTQVRAPRQGRSNTALYAGAAVAVVAVLAGGAYLIASRTHQRSDLMTNAQSSQPPQVASAATATPPAAPAAAPTPTPVAPVLASAAPDERPVRPMWTERGGVRAVRRAEHRAAARAAAEEGADAAATVSPSQATAPVARQAAPPPEVAAPVPVPAPEAAAPVITPPPPGQ